MPVTVAILGAGAVALLAISVIGRRATSSDEGEDVDPRRAEEAIVRAASKSEMIVHFVRRTSRNVAGSTMLTVAFVAVLALAAFAGAMLDMVTAESGLATLDSAVAEWGAQNANPTSTWILGMITHLGSSVGAIIAIAIVGYLEWRRRESAAPAIFLTVVYGGHAIISNLLKLLVDRERPFVEHLVDTVSSSFPSTHSGTAAAVWAALALVVGARESKTNRILLGTGAILITAGVAASRALLGVHWLTDVLGGVAIGWSWFLLVATAFGGSASRRSDSNARSRQATVTDDAECRSSQHRRGAQRRLGLDALARASAPSAADLAPRADRGFLGCGPSHHRPR